MKRTDDPALAAFTDRKNEDLRKQFMVEQDMQVGPRKQKPKRKPKSKRSK